MAASTWLLVAYAVLAVDGSCKDALDCSLNGECAQGHCKCNHGWTGDLCGQLQLNPAKPLPDTEGGLHIPDGGSTWGMSVVKENSTSYHGYIAGFLNGCKLHTWGTNSYVQHVVAQSPEGPWMSREAAVPAWSHNPKVVKSPDGTYVMYHIGDGVPNGNVKDCNKNRDHQEQMVEPLAESPTSPRNAPFSIHFSDSLDGPWKKLNWTNTANVDTSYFTSYPSVDNVGDLSAPLVGKSLTVYQKNGGGQLKIPLTDFKPNPNRGGAWAWDACNPQYKFDNGAPLETANGSQIGSFRVTSTRTSESFGILAGNPCDVTYDYKNVDVVGPFSTLDGKVSANDTELNYFELVGDWIEEGVVLLGNTEDADGCRGACETNSTCTSYTYRISTGHCYARVDGLWAPNATNYSSDSVSGRPWSYLTDNPAPWIDPGTGKVTIMYRQDTKSAAWSQGSNKPQATLASMIGVYSAPDWRGPYQSVSDYGGPISKADYPFEENEDPFIWQDANSNWHALFHANTWGDSRGAVFPVPVYAGRHAFSLDGHNWTFGRQPVYNGKIAFTNGSSVPLARRERPFLLLDEDTRVPTHLYTGVQVYENDDKSFNLVQSIGSAK